MILKMEVMSGKFEGGFFTGTVKATTDRGIVGMQVSFELRKAPGLDSLVPMIAAECAKELSKSIGVVSQAVAEANS